MSYIAVGYNGCDQTLLPNRIQYQSANEAIASIQNMYKAPYYVMCHSGQNKLISEDPTYSFIKFNGVIHMEISYIGFDYQQFVDKFVIFSTEYTVEGYNVI